jgi:hypothetical protein
MNHYNVVDDDDDGVYLNDIDIDYDDDDDLVVV